MTEHQTVLLVAAIGATATLVVATVGGLAGLSSARRQRRREMYGKAIRAVTAWRELLYRVRRRSPGEEAALRDLFHERQDELLYYEAWVGTESKSMALSYRRFVRDVKETCEPLIREAWTKDGQVTLAEGGVVDAHPDIESYVDRFLADARGSLSAWPWFRVGVWFRNWSHS